MNSEKKNLFEPARSIYDMRSDDSYIKNYPKGLSRDLICSISESKSEPSWMLEKRLQAFDAWEKAVFPSWGPDLSKINFDNITYYARATDIKSETWSDVPSVIKDTFDKLGVPSMEQKVFAGIGAQYESTVVYHEFQEELKKQGVIFKDMDLALRENEELIREYFMTSCVSVTDHAFAALHGAVWSGGTFIYIPSGVKIKKPLQAYFRMNAKGMGQFEHTLIIADENSFAHYIEGCSAPRYGADSLHAGCVEIFVKKNARIKYTSIENWSRDTYNLNTKRAMVDENGRIEWLNGNMGAGTTMLYPCSVLRGRGASCDSLGVVCAGAGQHHDTGSKVIHAAPNTSATIISKSIALHGGVSTYRGVIDVLPEATSSACSIQCDTLLVDGDSSARTIPRIGVKNTSSTVAHEATTGRISEDQIFYLMSRGITDSHARNMVVSGFLEPVVQVLDIEYAVELNRLVEMEMEGSVG